ncbi:MAG: tetratricopeptide repeat protein [Phycisphaerales bacterium]|nr:tetratricopeptide repeat protein [Phycisphaerales bacterium]
MPTRRIQCAAPGWKLSVCVLALGLVTAPLRAADKPADDAAEQRKDAAVPPADPAQWIVDYALSVGQQVTSPQPQDAEYVLVWLDAAGRISPGLADAHLWRFDLLNRLGRDEAARAALADYCRAAPHDVHAAIQRLDLDFAAARNAEERLALCTDRLTDPDISAEFASDIHRRLAEIHYAQGDADAALADARRAVELMPLNLPAQKLLAEIEGRMDDPRTRVHLLVMELSVNPGSISARRKLADTLASVGMSETALTWYAHARQAFLQEYPERPVPEDLVLAEAAARADADDVDGALGLCRDLLVRDPANSAAAMALIAIARDAERTETATEMQDTLAAHLRELEAHALETHDAAVCAAIAAFNLDVSYDPHRALKFARTADASAPSNPAIRALLGRALVDTGQVDEGIALLKSVAGADQRAALALATALRSQQQADAAIAVLQQAAALRRAGRDYRGIRAVLRELHADMPKPPDVDGIRALLGKLNPALLNFSANPADFIHYEFRLQQPSVPLSAPIRAEVALVNNADFPVSVGSARMAPDHIAVSVGMANAPDTARPGYLTIDLNTCFLLAPGARSSRVVALDTIAAQALIYRQPQRELALEFTFTPDPVVANDARIVCGLPGIKASERRLIRRAVNASPEGQTRLAAQLRTGSEPERLAAIDIMLALIFERQEETSGKTQPYPMAHVDVDNLKRLLRVALRDRSALVRARAACALSLLPLDDAAVGDLAPLLSDRHFLPRLCACELFARQQGKVFLPVLERMRTDSDPLVARLAGLYRDALTRGAATPTPRPAPTAQP